MGAEDNQGDPQGCRDLGDISILRDRLSFVREGSNPKSMKKRTYNCIFLSYICIAHDCCHRDSTRIPLLRVKLCSHSNQGVQTVPGTSMAPHQISTRETRGYELMRCLDTPIQVSSLPHILQLRCHHVVARTESATQLINAKDR